MDWLTPLTQLIVGLAWPLTILVLVLTFRREIRARLSALREVKYPGGSITMEVTELAARIEQSQDSETAVPTLLDQPLPLGEGASQLSIARMHLNIETELLRLSRTLRNASKVGGWSVSRHVDELLRADVLDAELAENVRDFVHISSKILHGAAVDDATKLRATVIGASLVAQLHYRSQVRRLERDFEGHGLWRMHKRGRDADNKYHLWSAIAASLPEFDYSYEVYREALDRFNRGSVVQAHPHDALPALTLAEFIEVLEFRESELLRLLHFKGKWQDFEEANYWQWPGEWGDLGWQGPIIRHGLSRHAVEEDLLQTRNAIQRYQSKLHAGRMAASSP
jgi:hypothetical protein